MNKRDGALIGFRIIKIQTARNLLIVLCSISIIYNVGMYIGGQK